MRKLISHEKIHSHVKEIHELTTRVLVMAEQHGFGEESLKDLRIALDEAIANAVIHGNSGDEAREILVRCYLHDDETLEIRIRDEGHGFDVSQLPDPTHDDNILNPHGRGVFLIRQYMDAVTFNPRGNEIRIWKRK